MANTRTGRPESFRRRQTAGTVLSFPMEQTPHSILLVFKDYSYSKVEQYRTTTDNLLNSRIVGARNQGIARVIQFGDGVELPFPKQLQETTSLRLTGFERDAITETITDFVGGLAGKSLSSAANDIKSGIGNVAGQLQQTGRDLAQGNLDSIVDGLLNKAKSLGINDAARAATYLLRNMLPGDIAKTADLVTGQAINPKEALAFEGVDLRAYSFSWELYPSSLEESERIRKIVNVIRRNSLPETQDLALIQRAFLKYPSTCEIRLLGVDTSHFPKFKPCMIGNVSVDYGNGGTIPIMRDGKPGSVTLSIELQEMSIHTREDEPEEDLASPF